MPVWPTHYGRLHQASLADIPFIQATARSAWEVTYASIISGEQFAFDFDREYNTEALTHVLLSPSQRFYCANNDLGKTIGFLAVGFCSIKSDDLWLHKIYLQPSLTGQGFGTRIVNDLLGLITLLQDNGPPFHALHLYVNRYNRARLFYEQQGFTIVEQCDTLVGHSASGEPYFRNDYQMTRPL